MICIEPLKCDRWDTEEKKNSLPCGQKRSIEAARRGEHKVNLTVKKKKHGQLPKNLKNVLGKKNHI